MPELTDVLADLRAESESLDALVAPLDDASWRRETPAEGWTIAHQIGHLAWTDDASVLAASDSAGFTALIEQALADPDLDGFVDRVAEQRAALAPAALLDGWRSGRDALGAALAAVPAGTKLPWFGPPMSPTSMATARIMETWAHGQDVADTLGVRREATDRLRHVAHIGVRTRDFAFAAHELTPPAEPFRVELTGPSGAQWTWGPIEASQRVSGPAEHFCLLVTQRRHRDDLALVAQGADADAWLGIAQAFAGPPGTGRAAGAFA